MTKIKVLTVPTSMLPRPKQIESSDLKLETAFSLKTEIIEINKVSAGQTVGYGGTYKTLKDTYIAVCPVGYADGLS